MRIAAALFGLFSLCFGGAAEAQFGGQTWVLGAVNYPTPDFSPCDFNVPTTFTNVWYIDQVNGHSQTFYGALTTDPAISPHQGDAAHPWDSMVAVFGAATGYAGALLSTAPGTGGARVIQPGDEVLLMTGSYGAVSAASGVNSSFVTFAAAPGQTPLFTTLNVTGDHLAFDGMKVQKNPLNGILLNITGHNIVVSHAVVSASELAIAENPASPWTQADWITATNYGLPGTGIGISSTSVCSAVLNPHVYIIQEGIVGIKSTLTLIKNAEVDHFTEDATRVQGGRFVDVENDYLHDPVLVGGEHTDFKQLFDVTGFASSDVWLNGGLMLYQADPLLPKFCTGTMCVVNGCIDITDGNWSNVYLTNNACFLGTTVTWNHGYDTGACYDCLIANNVVDNEIRVNKVDFSRGSLYSGFNTIVVNNLSTGLFCTETTPTGQNINMMNNIIMYPGTTVSNASVCYNGTQTVFSAAPNTTHPGGNYVDTSGISSELMNIDFTSLIYNFHLKAGAPAIGFGRSALPRPLTDYYGNPTNSPPDNGAVAYP